MDFLSLKETVLQLLHEKTAKTYIYHTADHTFDVMNAVENLLPHFDLDIETAQLIQAAALLHETGMTRSVANHEGASVAIAGELLPGFGYKTKQIERIGDMILATAMPQKPQTLEAQILCDADLDYLGRDDYFIISHKLRLEWIKTENYTRDLLSWYRFQQQFLSSHTYFTAAARSLRQLGKSENIRLIAALLQQAEGSEIQKK
ncbi:MAG: HD domain-containing protein [Bacteroidales bacterium]|nr:HD domain-containing protein [Bacteroidales bacterium]